MLPPLVSQLVTVLASLPKSTAHTPFGTFPQRSVVAAYSTLSITTDPTTLAFGPRNFAGGNRFWPVWGWRACARPSLGIAYNAAGKFVLFVTARCGRPACC